MRELEASVTQIPAKLEPLRRDLAKLEGMLAVERGKLSETETWQKSQRDYIDKEREALRSAQAKFQASKNSKEFNASSREVENKRKAISDRETELKKINETTATSVGQLETRDKDVEGLRGELAKGEAAIADQLDAAKQALAEAKVARDVARGLVEKQWLKIYDSLVAKRGNGVSAVVKGVCQGCHMALPPQLNNILAQMKSIETCPRCGRLVYRKELLDPTPETATPPDATTPA